MPEKEAHITVRDLTMAYGDFVLMRDLTFTINRGDVFIIMGGSGCGKSTMMTRPTTSASSELRSSAASCSR